MPPKRQPLSAASSRANMAAAPAKKLKTADSGKENKPSMRIKDDDKTEAHVIHHDTSLTISKKTKASPAPSKHRLSAATTNEDDPDSKRVSQVSTTSTNASTYGRRRKTHVGPWKLGIDLGKGCCGKVRKVKHITTGQIAAVKIIEKKVAEVSRAESLVTLVERSNKTTPSKELQGNKRLLPFGIEREIVIMKLLSHPNIVELYDVWENRNELYIVMEYVDGGELFDYVERRGEIPEDETVWIFRQLVAAMLHCHRLGIHHRDLKPENILITETVDQENGNINPQVKLADFGMAALQPSGQLLSTPCGSVHYAAPEVFEKMYDGNKIDVWSLGVILYVMLTGLTPFSSGMEFLKDPERPHALLKWYSVIKSGDYKIPEKLSTEANDLIKQMLNPEPLNRIDLLSAWKHDFFKKWSKRWGETEEEASIECWIGSRLMLGTWEIKQRKDIDGELLRHLQCLWHSVSEETLIRRLLSRERNHEKYFYAALRRYQEEQLEQFVGLSNGVAYSSSDYHHVKKVDSGALPPVPATAFDRSASQFSLVNDELKLSKASLLRASASVSSYDPFRASRNPTFGSSNAGYTSIIVHRNASRNMRRSGTVQSLRVPGSGRAGTIASVRSRPTSGLSAGRPKSRIVHRVSSSPYQNAMRRSASRTSMGSSLRGTSPMASFMAKTPSKSVRAMDFSQGRKASNASTAMSGRLRVINSDTIEERSSGELTSTSLHATCPSIDSSRTPEHSPRQAKHSSVAGSDRARDVAAPHTNSVAIASEARKVSSELEKYCEEAFNRSSVGSSTRTSTTQPNVRYDTPPSSVSRPASVINARDGALPHRSVSTPRFQSAIQDPAEETPNTFLQRELEETRQRLAARVRGEETAQSKTYHEVLAHLEELMKHGFHRDGEKESKLPVRTSASEGGSPHSRVLSSEINDGSRTPHRHTHPSQALHSPENKDSIRVITPPRASLPPVKPLVIRKTSNAAVPTSNDSRLATYQRNPVAMKYNGRIPQPNFNEDSITTPYGTQGMKLGTISEETEHAANKSKPTDAMSRRNEWYRRQQANESKRSLESLSSVRAQQGSAEKSVHVSKRLGKKEAERYLSQEYKENDGKKVRFFGFWNKMRGTSGQSSRTVSSESKTSSSKSTAASSTSGKVHNFSRLQKEDSQTSYDTAETASIVDLGIQRSWLSRLFNVKPASRTICFDVGRGRILTDLVRMLRSWKQYGMQDVTWERDRKVVFGTIAAGNALGIKPVMFVVQLFAVLEHGQRARLCIARFTQRKGATSSFRRVVEEVEHQFACAGLLVVDAEKKRTMEAILDGP